MTGQAQEGVEAASDGRHLGRPAGLACPPANADDRAEVGRLNQAVQVVTGKSVDVAYADQGYNGSSAAPALGLTASDWLSSS